ncbi:hypothetical protein EX30DRAFT_336530 [Ascodesmis nigricans]|uniref:PLC-like phosphodiesterase n=1 Tax=Ascodesmis nigricans TaxID=341454 RepID=A0A4V3SHJ7_9PEZI|nr:hypothetical protein EX30DRAFT_336530 [Ascodesmis nigricans]
MRLHLLPFLLSLLLPITTSAQQACNSSPTLCARPYSSILHLGTHNAPFTRNSTTSFSSAANQYFTTTVQLDAGIRLLQAQVHLEGSDIRLCHTSCWLFDAGTLGGWLGEIKTWLEGNKNDVVTLLLVNPDRIVAAQLEAPFREVGLAEMVYTPPSVTSWGWPTLGELIAADKRLIVFVSTSMPSTSPLLSEFSFIYETAYENTSPLNFTCAADRGTPGDTFPLINHWVYQQPAANSAIQIFQPNETAARVLNGVTGEGNMRGRLAECNVTRGFVLVDFFAGEMEAIDEVNEVETVVGRKQVPEVETREGGKEVKKSGSGRAGWGGWGMVEAVVVAGLMWGML